LAVKASTKPCRLKVFQAAFGFHESVVAAPNQGAALKAWGVRQNLFAEGAATIATDAAAVRAALARPQTPLRRAVGSKAAFKPEADASDLPDVPPPSPRSPPKAKGVKAPKVEPSKPPPPDRAPMEKAQARLRAIDEDRRKSEAELQARQAALDREAQADRKDWLARRKTAAKALEIEQRAYIKAGGEDG